MANVKEIRARIEGVKETRKITNAMYLVASTKLRHAREALDRTRPYFDAMRREVARVFRSSESADSRYFFGPDGSLPKGGVCGILVVTADKGLAGSYNMNAIRRAEAILKEKPDARLFVIGEYGRRYFRMRHIPTQEGFLYTAQDPTLDRARTICTLLLDLYDNKELNEIVAVFTDMQSSLSSTAQLQRLLPLEREESAAIPDLFRDAAHGSHAKGTGTGTGTSGGGKSEASNKASGGANGKAGSGGKGGVSGKTDGESAAGENSTLFNFVPSAEEVLAAVTRSYISGFLYSALVDSFCCEQNARVTAMDAAGRNADELLSDLSLQLNRERQSAITQEITEISAGAKAQKHRKEAAY